MTLQPCLDCGHLLSPRAHTCPECGSPIAELKAEEVDRKSRAEYIARPYAKKTWYENIYALRAGHIILKSLFGG